MPIHDWTRVDAGVFHHFHTGWLVRLGDILNERVLPEEYYALAEQTAGDIGPDVLTLERRGVEGTPDTNGSHGITALLTPPRVQKVFRARGDFYTRKQRRLTIRHRSGDRLVAVVEIVSPGNKASSGKLRRFVDKAVALLQKGVQLLVVDLFPPTRRDPQGIHGAIWAECDEEAYRAPEGKALTAAAYAVGEVLTAYVEPLAVGDPLPEMPLFLTGDEYIEVPLETCYQEAFRGLPAHLRGVLGEG